MNTHEITAVRTKEENPNFITHMQLDGSTILTVQEVIDMINNGDAIFTKNPEGQIVEAVVVGNQIGYSTRPRITN